MTPSKKAVLLHWMLTSTSLKHFDIIPRFAGATQVMPRLHVERPPHRWLDVTVRHPIGVAGGNHFQALV